jgi:hypothetical protein
MRLALLLTRLTRRGSAIAGTARIVPNHSALGKQKRSTRWPLKRSEPLAGVLTFPANSNAEIRAHRRGDMG